MHRSHPRPSRGETSTVAVVTLVALGAAVALQAWWMAGTNRRLDALQASLEKVAEARGGEPNRAAGEGSLDEKLDAVRADLDILSGDVIRLERMVGSLVEQLENRGTVSREPEQPPDLDWTQPELFERARASADTVGIALTRDEVRVPARLVLRAGALEYLVVLKGGKEHETLFSIVGNTLPDVRRPKDMGVKLNNALQALGFRRGTPIRVGPDGTKPAAGMPIHIYAEWTTGGRTEVVRGEDLVWHMRANRTMDSGEWVYVGSRFVEGEEPGTLDYAADLTAEVVATYSAPATMIDTTDEGAQDDTVFIVATPRIPEDVDHCTLIFRKDPLPASSVKQFPPVPKDAEDGGK